MRQALPSEISTHTIAMIEDFLIWEGFSTDSSVLYSILYNGSYMLPELIITVIAAVILLNVPEVRKLFRPDED